MSQKKLFLLDGMALIYRAHFALIRNPIKTSDGRNTSALYGFTNTVLHLLDEESPSHVALALDTSEPTERHEMYADYKAQREETPEDIDEAIPAVERLAAALGIPVLKYPGYEADDIIGTLAVTAEQQGFDTYMVTPDKDFAQLVDEHSFLYRPSRQGDGVEVWGVSDVREKWNVAAPAHVADVLGLWGDASDNIPGVPGVGEKTAKKLIGEYRTVENLLDHLADLKGKQKERLEEHRHQALLSKRLATIRRDVPVAESPDDLLLGARDNEALRALFVDYEFNAIGKRVFGEAFQAGRGHGTVQQGELVFADLKTIADVPHSYRCVETEADRASLLQELTGQKRVCFDVETDRLNVHGARPIGIAFSWKEHEGAFVLIEGADADAGAVLRELRPFFENERIEKVGHNLKFDLTVLQWNGCRVVEPFFDTMPAHFLVDPGRRHSMDQLAEQYLGYSPVPIRDLIGEKKSEQKTLLDVPRDALVEYAVEDADVTLQLVAHMEPLLEEAGQKQVFYDIEMPLLPVLVDMEVEGVALDPGVLERLSGDLAKRIEALARDIYELAGTAFNLNSPKQLGEILFDRLQIADKPKKTRTGQYATGEQVLMGLRGRHEIVDNILEYRELSKLKNTYVDALPKAVLESTGRIHTTFSQTAAATGRLASSNPNLQNIPIRTETGRGIRRAFTVRADTHELIAADYSQIELRVMADMSGDEGLRAAFRDQLDIHAATASRVYGVPLEEVSGEMRRKAKMVNFGIIYGISAFGLAQRLGSSRQEAAEIIEAYFEQYPGVRRFMDETVAFCREHGYVETRTGRRRSVQDIDSANQTTRSGAERIAINSPIQGTAADMIKLAMIRIQRDLRAGGWQTRLVLQVHDELVFEGPRDERDAVTGLIAAAMKDAFPLAVPVEVDIGAGRDWLAAHG